MSYAEPSERDGWGPEGEEPCPCCGEGCGGACGDEDDDSERAAGGHLSPPIPASRGPLGDADLTCDFDRLPAPEPDVPPPASPWHARRGLAFGASDAAALLIATGRRSAEDSPRWVQDQARVIRVALGGHWHHAPRLYAIKAGLAAEPGITPGSPPAVGLERERALWDRFVRELAEHEAASLLDPSSLRYVPDAVPREWLPFPDRERAPFAATPDAYAHDVLGDHVAVELKCSVQAVLSPPAHYVAQLHVQMACMGAASGLLVVGQQWAAGWQADGPVAVWAVERDEALIEELRAAAREGWAAVERLMEQREAA